jgi:hypothetical protein
MGRAQFEGELHKVQAQPLRAHPDGMPDVPKDEPWVAYVPTNDDINPKSEKYGPKTWLSDTRQS